LWLQVWDSGIGIARKDKHRVFDEFFQVTRTTRSGRQGLGLGLTIVQRTAQRLSHPVRVRSRPGRGTVFEIGIPIAFAEPEHSGDAVLAPLLDGRLVLLIDDDPIVLKNMAALLTGFNCQVLTASSLVDALKAVDQCLRLPDLIITDFHLGQNDTGLDAVSQVRALTKEDIPAVLVTTHPAAASNSGRLPILTKPLRPQALAKALVGIPKYQDCGMPTQDLAIREGELR
jgi:CheY-like chemotaxis protein